MSEDLELLRRYEPILRFTNGELFFPMPTDGYVAACDLLVGQRTTKGIRVPPSQIVYFPPRNGPAG